MNKKKISLFVTLILFTSLICVACGKKPPVEIDPFENISIKERGWQGTGKIEIKKNDYSYNGRDETIIKLLDSIHFDIKPNKNLKNGDTVHIYLEYNESMYERVNVKFTRSETTYTMSNLIKKDIEIETIEKPVKDFLGEDKTDVSQNIIIDGIRIPTAWNLTEEEMQAYIEYVKQSENGENAPETGALDKWSKGRSEIVTKRKDSVFYLKDYAMNDRNCYKEAYNYGDTSSQKYKIVPIVEESKTIGYKCIFKEE